MLIVGKIREKNIISQTIRITTELIYKRMTPPSTQNLKGLSL